MGVYWWIRKTNLRIAHLFSGSSEESPYGPRLLSVSGSIWGADYPPKRRLYGNAAHEAKRPTVMTA